MLVGTMNILCIKNTIFSIVLTQLCYAVCSANLNHERGLNANVFTRFMQVPWMNLNSSWMNQVTATCRDDIVTLFESADAGKMWALQMLDASSKIPSGIFTGNILDLGMYDECIRVKAHDNSANIQGRHCMVSMSMPTKFVEDAASILYVQRLSVYNPTADVAFNFAASLCLPSSCGVQDVAGLVNASIQSTRELSEFEVRVVRATCSSIKSEVEVFTLGTTLTLSFFAVVVILLLFCTACDFWIRVRPEGVSQTLETIAKFSFYTNAMILLNTNVSPGNMPAIHGIRFLSISAIVLVHRILATLIKPTVNLLDFYELRDIWLTPVIFMLPYAVDTFFTLTGFLTAYVFLKLLSSGHKFNLLHLYLHRYIRLTPCLIALILFNLFILPHLGSGPIWETVLGVTNGFCEKNWWTNFLYVQNFINPHQMCVLHTWYLAVEMQLYWISPIILYPLFYRPKLGLAILGVLLTASFFTHATQILLNQYAFLFRLDRTFQQRHEEFFDSYTITYNRALPYFVGMLLGYYVINKKRDVTKLQAAFCWILSCIFVAFCVWNTYYVQPNSTVYNAVWEATYVSVGRLGWSLAVAWIIYACTQGHGGPVTRFLSLPIFVPLSRLAYCIYLVSALIQVGSNATIRVADYKSDFSVSYLIWGDLAISIFAAVALNLCFETPVIVMEKILRTKRSPPSTP